MSTSFTPLPTTTLAQGAGYHRPPQPLHETITLNAPAVEVMTDLTRVTAVTIEPGVSIDVANQKMLSRHVRLLLVTDSDAAVVGIITATDILGEKPVLFMQKVACSFHDITVEDIMTPRSQLEVIHMVDVENARVGNIVECLKQQGRQHALVVDVNESNLKVSVRGIFSCAQISKQLGINIETSCKASTFAELEQALSA